VTLKRIANNEPTERETLYDRPLPEKHKVRVTGPFTVEAVPAPVVKAFDEIDEGSLPADESIARTGQTQRQSDWCDGLSHSVA
jgi:adenine-specific DNA-methyltransferase